MSLHLLLFLSLICQYCIYASTLGNDTDRLSLMKFKDAITFDPFNITNSWNSSTHFCGWHGITCDDKQERVIKLKLVDGQLSGSISPFIGNISSLRVIILQNNNFHGEIPQELSHLFQLQTLVIETNKLITGEFPINITSCSNLKTLSFAENSLIGKIPMEIGSLHKLEILFLGLNNFTGQIPTSLWNITSLRNLSLNHNNLVGSIPNEIGRLKSLRVFGANENNLSGAIPIALYNLSSLILITLTSNHFNGSLPTNMFSNLPNLTNLTLGINELSGHIPTSISNATKLEMISIGRNGFVGKIPNLGKLHSLSFLEISQTNVGYYSSYDWEFLNSLSNCTKLARLDLHNNNFGGHLPDTIGNLSTQLTTLDLTKNQIRGTVPVTLGNLVNLTELSLEKNFFTENIPITFGKFQNMQRLSLGGNKFSGEIIHFIGNLSQLFHLDLSHNMFEGKVPPSIGNCKNLQYLDLSDNNFSGSIPVQLTNLSSLSILLNLSHNSFGGDIPDEVGSLKNVDKFDVSHNHFTGSIPRTIGLCQSLESLFLQGNLFQETIPSSLASLKALRYLDLSQNNLSGSIPKDLQDIAVLEYLNVSFNLLDGEVPTKGVFSNASAISLMGNNKLCGGISKLELLPCPFKSSHKRKFQHFKLIISICCVIAFLLLASIVAIFHVRRRIKTTSSSSPTVDLISKVSYQSLHNATNGFSVSNLIGSGSFGSVYKGSFQSQEVFAIKVINLKRRGAQKSFLAECDALRNAKHRNLVKLITCCSSIDYKGQEFKALVYEYMVNGSLENWLHPNTMNPCHPRILILDQIINILIDIVSALHYLHNEFGQPLIHCDLKPSNVLLDEKLVAHLSDFGLARLLSSVEVFPNEHSSTIGVKGTIGYIPPEYGAGSQASMQGDIYSFGILVLEMLTKRKPTEDIFKDGYNLQKYVQVAFPDKLLEVVSQDILQEELTHVVEASLGDLPKSIIQIHPNIEKCLCSLFKIGLTCSVESPHERMRATDVLKELNSIKSFFFP